ncbi:MAG: lactonase family protein [Planctomycetes bacterium]|nr:lactonase family protein [Planctomycetota bacterium]MBM4057446.1 lactonase family protein [Planctomycetota bacterium]
MPAVVLHAGWLVVACLISLPLRAAADELVWFGTYSRGETGSEGIYVSRFDGASGRLSEPVLAAKAVNPSFLAFHPQRPLLYAVAEMSDGSPPTGGVVAFAVDEASGTLRPLNARPSGGGGPCHVTVDPTGRAVLAANYGGGSLICFGIADDGGLQPVATTTPGGFIQHASDRAGEAGADPRRQEHPHAHSVDVAADGRFAFCCDLGLDAILIYKLNAARATLVPHGRAALTADAGPRHFALHPSGRFAWCVNELSLTVTGFTSDAAAGTLHELQTITTLPDEVTKRSGFTTAEIACHPSGRFLYASNRGHDSIAMYTVDERTGGLSFLGTEPIRGQTPRSFAISPDGRFLLAAGQGSGTVTVFSIDTATGRLSFTGQSIRVPAPVCVLFRRQGGAVNDPPRP